MRAGRTAAAGRTVAVLRESDQRAGRIPQACVRTGQRTDGAVTQRVVALQRFELWTLILGSVLAYRLGALLGRTTSTVVLPVTPNAYRSWRKRLTRCVLASSAGVALLVVGAVQHTTGIAVLGVVLAVGGWNLRARWWVKWWVGLEYRPGAGHILVSRVHRGFDAEARELFLRGVGG
jgi:hypothetical protein